MSRLSTTTRAFIGNKISKIRKEGKPLKQAIAIAYSMAKSKKK